MSLRAASLLATSFLVFAGCTDGPASDVEGSRQASVATSTGGEPVETTAPDYAAERHAKQTHREAGETEVAEIDWSDAASYPPAETETLSDEARAAIDGATLPVLLPREETLKRGAVVTRGPTWYAASLHPDGHHITISGRKLAVHQPSLAADVPEARRRRPGELSITRTHGIVSASFEAFGATYTMDVECEAPSTDLRCTEDAYTRSLFDGLGVAGGTP